MQLSVFIMDWDWLTAFPTEERTAAFSRDDSNDHREDQSAINDDDLARDELLSILPALEDLSKKADKRTGDLIATAFAPLWSGRDDLDLDPGAGFTCLSPSTIARMAGALDALDLWALARRLAEEDGEEFVVQDHAFLKQIARIIHRARERGWGLIEHYG